MSRFLNNELQINLSLWLNDCDLQLSSEAFSTLYLLLCEDIKFKYNPDKSDKVVNGLKNLIFFPISLFVFHSSAFRFKLPKHCSNEELKSKMTLEKCKFISVAITDWMNGGPTKKRQELEHDTTASRDDLSRF